MSDAEPRLWPWEWVASLGDVGLEVDLHSFPRQSISLATPPPRPHSGNHDKIAARADRGEVLRHRVIRKEPAHDRAELITRCGKRIMHPPPKLILDRFDLGLHPFARALAPELEALAVLGPPADMGEAVKVEGVGLVVATPCSGVCPQCVRRTRSGASSSGATVNARWWRLHLCGPAPVTRHPDSGRRPRFAGSLSLWPRRLPPQTPPRIDPPCSPASQVLSAGLTSPVRASSATTSAASPMWTGGNVPRAKREISGFLGLQLGLVGFDDQEVVATAFSASGSLQNPVRIAVRCGELNHLVTSAPAAAFFADIAVLTGVTPTANAAAPRNALGQFDPLCLSPLPALGAGGSEADAADALTRRPAFPHAAPSPHGGAVGHAAFSEGKLRGNMGRRGGDGRE